MCLAECSQRRAWRWSQGIAAAGEELGPLVLIDTAGCGMEEVADEDSDSKRNEGEAKVCTAWLPEQ